MNGIAVPGWATWIIAVLVPIINTAVIQQGWPRWLKSLCAFLIAVGAGLLATWASGQFNPGNILATVATIFTISQLVYDQYIKNKQEQKKQ